MHSSFNQVLWLINGYISFVSHIYWKACRLSFEPASFIEANNGSDLLIYCGLLLIYAKMFNLNLLVHILFMLKQTF